MARYRILIVEDNEINQKVLFAYLSNKDITLTLAKNGKEALQLSRENQYDCILMDIAMPVMDGIEATRSIRKKESIKKSRIRTPIIAVTASDPINNRFIFKDAGFDDYVPKPICPLNLKKKITQYSKIRF